MLTTDPAGTKRFRERRRLIADDDLAGRLRELGQLSTDVRRSVVRMIDGAQLGHIGGDLSVTDILVTLFGGVLAVDPEKPRDPDRDRFILSKGHCAAALEQLHGRSHLHDPHGHGWHLDRARFDAFLRSAAGAAGAELRRAEAVPHLTHAGDRRVLIREDGRLEEVRCDWVVDATGRRAVIGRRRGRRRKQDRLVALFALFGRRLPGHRTEDAELRTLVEAVPGGWWYTAKVPAGRLVAHLTDADLTDSALRTAEGFLDAIGTTRHVRTRLDGYDPAHAPAPCWTAAHGLRLSPAAGPGWIAAGDAALAFDPLSSQGILTALHTGARAGRTVDLCLSGETAALTDYSLFLQRITDAYERHHAEIYGQEQRWSEHPFWERRQQMP
ncbi:tryptophan 7-halogenase [Streptomyces coeruleorubidus]|uniref:tryptophan 7-halogenase n=1 Tax=Streptomyces coeruleorubidus TaxID=116188 RepID=UPI003824D16A